MQVMKPIAKTHIPNGDVWLYEVKYDGFRCVLDWTTTHIKLISKNNTDLTPNFPEVVAHCLEYQAQMAPSLPLRLDGELVILNTIYQANFSEIQRRGRLKNKATIQNMSLKRPATFMVFDVMQVTGESLENKPLIARKRTLNTVMQQLADEQHVRIQLVETFTTLEKLTHIIFDFQSEGIITKHKQSIYQAGKGHQDWFKIKNWRHVAGILYAYNTSNGYFSVGVMDEDDLMSIGSCKHGLNTQALTTLKQLFLTEGNKKDDIYTLPPAIVASIHTLDLHEGVLREPQFNDLTTETPAETCTSDKLRQDLAMLPPDVPLTNLDKPFWPDLDLTKRDLLIYIRTVAPYMLPFMKQRALTIIRCPDGVDGAHFFQKHRPDYTPDFIDYFLTDEDEKGLLCNNLESLIWFANHGTIEYHLPFQMIADKHPSEIVFDLDPPSRAQFHDAVEAALLIKTILDDLKLTSFIKTSGNKGLQIHIPLPKNSLTYDDTALFTASVARTIVQTRPNSFTTERLKNKRNGRLYIDYVQHAKNKTIIAPYSPRKTADATIATPLYWEEVTDKLRPEPFTLRSIVKRVHKQGCPFTGYFQVGEQQDIETIKMLLED